MGSGQYSLNEEEIKQIKKILIDHGIDFETEEVSIQATMFNDWEKDETFVEEVFYIQSETNM